MGRPKTRTVTTTIQDNADEQVTLRGYMSTFDPSEIEVKIFRRERATSSGTASTDAWLATWPPDEVTEEAIAEKFGPGKYLIRPADLEGHWKPSRIINISREACESFDSGNGASTFGVDPQISLQMKMLELQLQMQRESGERFYQLLCAQLGAKPAGGRDTKEIIELFSALKNISGGGNLTAQVRDVIELSKELQPAPVETNGGAASSPWGVLAAVLPSVLARANGQAALPGGQVNPEELIMQQRIQFMQRLKTAAAAGKDPQFWANYIVENEDTEEPCKWISSMVDQYDWPTLLAGLKQSDPQIGAEPFQSWFEKLYSALTADDEEPNADGNSKPSA